MINLESIQPLDPTNCSKVDVDATPSSSRGGVHYIREHKQNINIDRNSALYEGLQSSMLIETTIV